MGSDPGEPKGLGRVLGISQLLGLCQEASSYNNWQALHA